MDCRLHRCTSCNCASQLVRHSHGDCSVSSGKIYRVHVLVHVNHVGAPTYNPLTHALPRHLEYAIRDQRSIVYNAAWLYLHNSLTIRCDVDTSDVDQRIVAANEHGHCSQRRSEVSCLPKNNIGICLNSATRCFGIWVVHR